jgi:hypothetical protein
MGRTLVSSCGLLVLITFVSAPAYAGDRKSSGREDSKMELFGSSQKSRAVLVSGGSDRPNPSGASLFDGDNSTLASKRLGGHDEKERSGEPKREYKKLTLFHFDSKLGEVKVQPVFGKVTGAQLSLDF